MQSITEHPCCNQSFPGMNNVNSLNKQNIFLIFSQRERERMRESKGYFTAYSAPAPVRVESGLSSGVVGWCDGAG